MSEVLAMMVCAFILNIQELDLCEFKASLIHLYIKFQAS